MIAQFADDRRDIGYRTGKGIELSAKGQFLQPLAQVENIEAGAQQGRDDCIRGPLGQQGERQRRIRGVDHVGPSISDSLDNGRPYINGQHAHRRAVGIKRIRKCTIFPQTLCRVCLVSGHTLPSSDEYSKCRGNACGEHSHTHETVARGTSGEKSGCRVIYFYRFAAQSARPPKWKGVMQLNAMRTVLDALPIAVAFVDTDERVLIANRAAASILGPTPEGRRCSALLRHPEFLGGLEAALNGKVQDAKRLTLIAGGSETHLAVTFTPMESDVGQGVLVAFEDLTPIEQAGAMRRDFVANVSHELRTPLTALVGFIETLRGAARDDAAARDRFLGIMEREAGRMIRLVSDLLSLSRVEAEERRRPADEVDIAALLKTTLVSHRDAATTGGIRVRLEMAEGPVRLRADADQLTQVFHNLVENAIKYGGAGKEVTVRVSEIEREPVLKGPAVQVEVIDRGEGIDPLHLPRLTERFYRVDTHRSREQGGTGLGLAIVKHIVNRHRGRLRIESEPGKGSRFIVILPKALNSPAS